MSNGHKRPSATKVSALPTSLAVQSPAPAPLAPDPLGSVESIIAGLAGVGYIASRRIATALFMATHLQKPVLVEGVAGVGKTELALCSAALLGLPLIRLQCYEGLDESRALYEWKYGKQLLYTQILKDHMGAALTDAPDMATAMERLHGTGDLFFSEPFLEPRPLLNALREPCARRCCRSTRSATRATVASRPFCSRCYRRSRCPSPRSA